MNRFKVSKTLFVTLFCLLSIETQSRISDPEIPSIERPVHLTDHKDHERPYIPVYRTTHDGRLSVNLEEGVQLYLNTPEKFGSNFQASPKGQTLLASTQATKFSDDLIHKGQFGAQNHLTFCEPSNQQGQNTNPYACGVDNKDDCYDLVFTTFAWENAERTKSQMWGTPGTVRVTNPKTPHAQIADVNVGTPKAGGTIFTFTSVFEPMFTQDGNLLIGRIAENTITWNNARTGAVETGQYDMVYFPAPQNPAKSCDVTQFDEVKPLGHAPYDPEINQTYGFAMQPFVDSMGNVIPDGRDLSGTYPWIDSKGDNIGFSALVTKWDDEFPVSCVKQRGCDDNALEDIDIRIMGKTIVGLWTQGKMVLMDNLTNHIDYSRPQMEDRGHRNLDMYKANSREDGTGTGLVRVGNGRDNYNNYNGMAEGAAGNTSFLESIENKLNFWQHLKPVTPRDVVWHMSTGAGSDEFAFDDFTNPDTFISSSMVQAVWNDGQVAVQQNGIAGAPTRIQNGGTPNKDRLLVPSYGEVHNARIERVALGGVQGKGLWLSGRDSFVSYGIPVQPQNIQQTDWYFGLFVDARFENDGTVRSLITFPDSTELQLVGTQTLRYFKGSVIHTVNLPTPIPTHGWAHIGVQMSANNTQAELYFNGYLLNTFKHGTALFELSQGNLFVGDNPAKSIAGFTGWIDNFKVFAQTLDPEVACNHANGTLIGTNGVGAWANIANQYPASSHSALTSLLERHGEATSTSYACYADYSDDYQAYQANIPAEYMSIRESIIFPEGPLIHDLPRPDSSNNAFCLSCHTPTGKQGLDIDALTLNPNLTAANDPRRQPMQPAAKVFGNIPANWLGQGLPASGFIAPADGYAIDQLLLTGEETTLLAPEWPVTYVSPKRKGQSLLQQSSGMELRVRNGEVSLSYKPSNYANFDWNVFNTGSGYVYIENVKSGLRLHHASANSDVTVVNALNSTEHTEWDVQSVDGQWSYLVNRATGQKLQSHSIDRYAVSMTVPETTGNNVHWQLIDYVKEYKATPVVSTPVDTVVCSGIDSPTASVFATAATDQTLGALKFMFEANKSLGGKRETIKFSLNGGVKYPHKVADSIGQIMVNDLKPGDYNVWVAWGNSDCPTDLGTFTIEAPAAPEACTGTDIPSATMTWTDETAVNAKDGSITFSFINDKINGGTRSKIKFSLDGGQTYQGKIKDKKGQKTITGLTAGDYDLWVAWGDGACPTDLPDISIMVDEQPAPVFELCQGLDLPTATLSTVDTTDGEANGIIQFDFNDDGADRTAIKFSVNGGTSFLGKVKDKSGSTHVDALAAGTYPVWAAWGNGDCANEIGTVTIN